MGGFSFTTKVTGPIAYTGVGLSVRNLILEAMVAADAGWEVVGLDCPDCMFAEIKTLSAIEALQKAKTVVEKRSSFFKDSVVVWASGKSSRQVFFEAADEIINGLKDVEKEFAVIRIEDDYTHCDHFRMEDS